MSSLQNVVSNSVKASMARTAKTLQSTRRLLNRIDADLAKARKFEQQYVTRPKK